MQQTIINETCTVIKATNAMLDGSSFNNISFKNTTIVNANLSNLQIDGTQLGGAYLHNIGMPPQGHPMHNPNAQQQPLRFEDCNLAGSTITNCNLAGVVLDDCNVTGMKINGIPLEDLLQAYQQQGK